MAMPAAEITEQAEVDLDGLHRAASQFGTANLFDGLGKIIHRGSCLEKYLL
jgi:hypothetical protein